MRGFRFLAVCHGLVLLSGVVQAAEMPTCTSVEFRGDGPGVLTPAEDWEKILVLYAEVKRGLLAWLEKNRSNFSEKVSAFIESQILTIKLERAPITNNPDLTWRGIGVFAYDGKSPMIRLGSGFAYLAAVQPERAKFELTRLMIQSFLPCEIHRAMGEATSGVGVDEHTAQVWAPLLKCLQVSDSQGCGNGSYSESGWAISSTVAAVVSPPGCMLPVFKNPELARCMEVRR